MYFYLLEMNMLDKNGVIARNVIALTYNNATKHNDMLRLKFVQFIPFLIMMVIGELSF